MTVGLAALLLALSLPALTLPAAHATGARGPQGAQEPAAARALRDDLRLIYERIVQLRDAVVPGNKGSAGRAEREVFVNGRLSASRLANYVAEVNGLTERFVRHTDGSPFKLRAQRKGTAAGTVDSMIDLLRELHSVRVPLTWGIEVSETLYIAETYPITLREQGGEAIAAHVRSRLAGDYASWFPRFRPAPPHLKGGHGHVGSSLIVDPGALSFLARLHRPVLTASWAGPVHEMRLFLAWPTLVSEPQAAAARADPWRSGPFIRHAIRVFLDVRRPAVFRAPQSDNPRGLPRELMTGHNDMQELQVLQGAYLTVRASSKDPGALCADFAVARCSLDQPGALAAALERRFGQGLIKPVRLQASGKIYLTFVGFEELGKLGLWSDARYGLRYLTGDENGLQFTITGQPPGNFRSFALVRVV